MMYPAPSGRLALVMGCSLPGLLLMMGTPGPGGCCRVLVRPHGGHHLPWAPKWPIHHVMVETTHIKVLTLNHALDLPLSPAWALEACLHGVGVQAVSRDDATFLHKASYSPTQFWRAEGLQSVSRNPLMFA